MSQTASALRSIIANLQQQHDAAVRREDAASAQRISAVIAQKRAELGAAPPERVPPPVVEHPAHEVRLRDLLVVDGAPVRTRQGKGKVSEVVHSRLSGTILCQPGGVIETTTLLDAEGPINCSRCIRSAEVAQRRAAEAEQRARERAAKDAERAAKAAERDRKVAQRRSATPAGAVPYEPYTGPNEGIPDPVEPLPEGTGHEIRPEPAGSLTVGDLAALLLSAPIDATKPVRAVGRFTSATPLAFMVSIDGALVVMGAD